VRELEEELGVQIEPPQTSPWMTLRAGEVELDLYLIDRWQGEPRNTAPEEHDDIRWFAADELELLDLADSSYIDVIRQATTPLDANLSDGFEDPLDESRPGASR
jgi:8-oxo-dGTP diphosphatase